LKFALAQFDFPVGDIAGNYQLALDAMALARAESAGLLVFPELALTGYPPEDLLLRPGFMRRCHEAVSALVPQVRGVDIIIGHPWEMDGKRYNAASWIRDGRVIGRYFKHCLPNYAVFDERRYFTPGTEALVLDYEGVPTGIMICEDAWEREPGQKARDAGARWVLSPNASPYRDDKLEARTRMLNRHSADTGLPLVYCNLVGGQDELVFDGRSMLVNSDGSREAPGPLCREMLLTAEFNPETGFFRPIDWPSESLDEEAEIYTVLCRGLADYVHKNGFDEVVLGLSGGVDSALTLAIAVDALGKDKVHAVMMPSRHTSGLSIALAQEQATTLGIDYQSISIEPAFVAITGSLQAAFENHPADVTEENLQARIRGNIIMALSNKFGWLPLATSNKSELAVGYSTIYGDMCGGFSPLKDCLKTRVFDLCRYRNRQGAAIPVGVIDRAPSAELAPGQSDQDTLPPYEILDQILEMFVDQDLSIAEIAQQGFEETMVRSVAAMVLKNEYKRRQGAPGVRVTSKGFGRDRRYPITSGWRESANKIS